MFAHPSEPYFKPYSKTRKENNKTVLQLVMSGKVHFEDLSLVAMVVYYCS